MIYSLIKWRRCSLAIGGVGGGGGHCNHIGI